MKALFQTLQTLQEQGRNCCLISVVEKQGSVPRAGGAYMIADETGRLFGTIGGGISEHEAIRLSADVCKERKGRLEWLDLQPGGELGALCGGKQRVIWYYLDMSCSDVQEWIRLGLKLSEKRVHYWICLPYGAAAGLLPRIQLSEEMTELQPPRLSPHRFTDPTGEVLYEEHYYDGIVYCVGGGHVAQEVVPLLTHLDFECVLVEDRPEFASRELFPDASRVVLSPYDELANHLHIQEQDYILVMSSGHQGDLVIDQFALGTPAKFIGNIGSKTKATAIRQKLTEKGYDEEALSRLHSPIGLPIASQTPAEIAVSVAAQLIAVRNGRG